MSEDTAVAATDQESPEPRPPARARVTVVESVYHQAPGAEPESAHCRSSSWLASQEEPYRRNLAVASSWQPLDTGWVPEPGMVLLSREGARADEAVLEVAFAEDDGPRDMHSPPRRPPAARLLLPPGESLRIRPACAKDVLLRCEGGAKVRLWAYPR